VLLDLQFYVYVLQIVVFPFVLFLLAIVLSVLLRFRDADYPFGIFKLFLHELGTVNLNKLYKVTQSQNITNPNNVKAFFWKQEHQGASTKHSK